MSQYSWAVVVGLVDQVEVEVLVEEDGGKGKTGVRRKPNFSPGSHWSSQLANHWFNNWVLITWANLSSTVVRQQGVATDSESCWLCFCWSPPQLLLLLTCKSKLTAWAAGPSAVLPSSHGHTTLPRTFRPTPNTPSYYLTHDTSFLSCGIHRCSLKFLLCVQFPRNLKRIMCSLKSARLCGHEKILQFLSIDILSAVFIGTLPFISSAFKFCSWHLPQKYSS